MGIPEVSGEDENTEVIDNDIIVDDIVVDDVIEDAVEGIEEVKPSAENSLNKPPIYKGNAYDLTSLIALISGIGFLFLCLTCNLGYYLIPFLAIILGTVGVVMAHKSVNPERTRLLSWLGIGSGVIVALIILAGIALYIFFIILIIRSSGYSQF